MARLKDLDSPVAIAMWDFSWLQRHYKGGGFEDWDKVLDELVERGYNAVRIDAFPHLIAAGPDGKIEEKFRCFPQCFGFAYWGNAWTVDIEPRIGLAEFISKCQQRNIYIGLSTWFTKSQPNRNDRIEGIDELVRVWDETLMFLKEHDCLKNVVYVDVLNEYPQFHGLNWLHKMFDTMTEPKDAEKKYNDKQTKLYRNLINGVLDQLRNKWPEFDFLASQTHNHWEDDRDMDYSRFSLLDVHMWMVMDNDFSKDTGYFEHIHNTGSDCSDGNWLKTFNKMMAKWSSGKGNYIKWMEDKIKRTAEVANKWNIPIGNTEGWGPIVWTDHPYLSWDWVKEAGEISVKLAIKYGYSFICTSNFCHPYFIGMWEDVKWHKYMTEMIRNS